MGVISNPIPAMIIKIAIVLGASAMLKKVQKNIEVWAVPLVVLLIFYLELWLWLSIVLGLYFGLRLQGYYSKEKVSWWDWHTISSPKPIFLATMFFLFLIFLTIGLDFIAHSWWNIKIMYSISERIGIEALLYILIMGFVIIPPFLAEWLTRKGHGRQ